MKKIVSALLLVTFLSSCGATDTPTSSVEKVDKIEKDFTVSSESTNALNIYGNIVNNNTRNIVAHINGQIQSLNCKVGEKVTPESVIAVISPDPADLNYKSNTIQIASLNDQMTNLQSIKTSTLQNFNTQQNQLEIQKEDLETKRIKLKENLAILRDQKDLSGDDLDIKISSLDNQITNLENSKDLILKNKNQTLQDIEENIENLQEQIYNTRNKSIQRLDEVFAISEQNKNNDNKYEDYLGAEAHSLKSIVELKIKQLLNTKEHRENPDDRELSQEIKELSDTLKDAAKVVKNSIASLGSLSQTEIDTWYNEFLGYSDGILTYKMNLDKLKNALVTTALEFDTNIQEINANLDNLKNNKKSLTDNTIKSTELTYDSNINSLETQIESIKTSLKNLQEQNQALEEAKNTNIQQINSQISSLQDSISKTNVLLTGETLKAEVYGTIKASMADEGNPIQGGSPLCTIVPEKDSLKLEIYSPNDLEVGMQFEYAQNGEVKGTGTIISESPEKNSVTQNYTYEGNIDFSNFTAGDYLDIQILSKVASEEIWIPIDYIAPKLDGYYVNVKNNDSIERRKVEVGKMNNGNIQILSGISNNETLIQ